MAAAGPGAKPDREELERLLGGRGLGAVLGWRRADGNETPSRLWREGPPAGAITELVPEAQPAPPRQGAGVTSLALRLAAQRRGTLAWVDPLDRWDPAAAERAGLELERVLWLRGAAGSRRGMDGLGRWHRILGLLIQAAGLELIVADFLDWPVAELRRIPSSAWFRLLRGLERDRQTALLLLAPEPLTPVAGAALVEAVSWEAAAWPAVHLEARNLRRKLAGARRGPQSEGAPLRLELRA